MKIIYNRLLCGWYIVRGAHDTPIGGRFHSKADALAYLFKNKADRINYLKGR